MKRWVTRFAFVYVAGAVVASAGSLAIAEIGNGKIGERLDENARLRAALASDRVLVDGAAAASAQRARLREQLGAALVPADATARSAAFVREAARIAAQHRATVTSVVPAVRVTNVTRLAGVSGIPEAGLSFDLALEGRYADLLATVRALAQLRAPAAIEIASLTRKNPNLPDATLIAALHANLGRFNVADASNERASSN